MTQWIGGGRAHNAVLLKLARARLEDRARGIATAEESQRLSLPVTHVNIMVHRLRRQLAREGIVDAVKTVERRDRSGLMRVGPRDVKMMRIE